jgi:hypothetical protein
MEEYRVDPTIAYDVVELPTHGIYYANKKKSVKVSYLTAADENILSAQNLIESGSVLDELLKRKILDKDINVEEMAEDDKRAVLVFLRNTAFGSEYTITAIDPNTNKHFTETIDLSELKYREFNLTPDENEEYSYYMPKSKANITFKFITPAQEIELKTIADSWNGNGVAPVATKRLEFMIKSVAGNREMMNIYNFIERLPIKDSQDFKKYVNENKPGIDLAKTVKTPSGDDIQVQIGFGVEFFRPFYGI